MEDRTLLELFCNYNPNFLDTLDSFSKTDKQKILKKLKAERDKSGFRAIVAEIRFGELFKNMGFKVEYDKRYENQTPDWTISAGNEYAICEVYRLGKSFKDQKRSDFEDAVMEGLESLKFNCDIKLSFLEEYPDVSNLNPRLVVKKVENWLSETSRKVRDRIILDGLFDLEIIGFHKGNSIRVLGNINAVDIKAEKIHQIETLTPNEITKKLAKYNDLIGSLNIPYFLCVSLDFENGLDKQDFVSFFLGESVDFVDYGKPIAQKSNRGHYGKCWTNLGNFYKHSQLSGVIVCRGGEFSVIINPCKWQLIHSEQYNHLKKKILNS